MTRLTLAAVLASVAGFDTQLWTGEFSMTRCDGQTFEYGRHEGNHGLPNALRGGQAEAARTANPQ